MTAIKREVVIGDCTGSPAIEAAINVFAAHGIDFSAPWQCDLDDMEAERFHALRLALAIYAEFNQRANPPVAWRVKDYADGWAYYSSQAPAAALAREMGALLEPLYTAP